MSYDPRLQVSQFLAYVAWMRGITRKSLTSEIELALHRFEITKLTHDKMGNLSGGQLRRVGLALATIGEPDFLILDEPSVGLDPVQRLQFRKYLQADLAPIVLISTHLLEDVQHIANRVIVLHNKQLHFDGTVTNLESAAQNSIVANMSKAEAGLAQILNE